MTAQLNINKLMKPVPSRAFFAMDEWFVWGASVVCSEGTYHMYFSRWPREGGHRSWVTHSEIAHATAADPLGPFEFQHTVLGPREGDYWDADVAHNPNLLKYGDKFYLYYNGNKGDGDYYSHRNNQRVGVAVADNPAGPWQRFDEPLLDVSIDSWDSLMTTNPSCCVAPDGKFIMIYKAAQDIGEDVSQDAPVYHGIAFADNPAGPFIKKKEPIFTSEDVSFPGEDPYIWYQDDRFYTILKDMRNNYTDNERGLVLFESVNGVDWKLADQPLVTNRQIICEDEGVKKFHRVERPQILLEKGRPSVLYCAVKPDKDSHYSFNIHIPLS